MRRFVPHVVVCVCVAGIAAGILPGLSSAAPSSDDGSSKDQLVTQQEKPAQSKQQQDKPEKRPLSDFMQQKLDASNEILRGLMTDDLELVEENADKLLDMSREEKWRASNDMMYLQHSSQFGNAVDELREKAKDGSMDGASLAWINVTMSCIQCHNWVRNTIMVDDGNGTDKPKLSALDAAYFIRSASSENAASVDVR